jgi:hypothetical protein
MPIGPASPAGPCGPASPASPFGPGRPGAPVSPLGPRSPSGPRAPGSPFGPSGPHWSDGSSFAHEAWRSGDPRRPCSSSLPSIALLSLCARGQRQKRQESQNSDRNAHSSAPLATNRTQRRSILLHHFLGRRPHWWRLVETAFTRNGEFVASGPDHVRLHGGALILLPRWRSRAPMPQLVPNQRKPRRSTTTTTSSVLPDWAAAKGLMQASGTAGSRLTVDRANPAAGSLAGCDSPLYPSSSTSPCWR